MEAEGQKTATNPAGMLAGLLSGKAKLHDELRIIENQVYDMETIYLHDPSQCGNVLKGFEGFLSASKSTALLKRSRKFQLDDRLFSLSSATSPADPRRNSRENENDGKQDKPSSLIDMAEELAAGRDDGRSDIGLGRCKGGGIYSNGQGKPKKGRPTPRDAKRIRHSSEQDFDYDDDPDLTL